MDLLPIATVDLLVVLLAIVGAIIGFRSGAIPQVLGLLAAGAAVAAIVYFAPQVIDALSGLEQPARALVAIGGAFAIVAVAQAVGSGLGASIRNRLGRGVVGGLDSVLGSGFGILQVLVVTWLVGGLVATSSLPVVAAETQKSVAIRWLVETLPPPSEVIGEVGAVLDESGLPQVFAGIEPLPAPPVEVPGNADVARIAAQATASTVKVDARGCGESFTGTAFGVAEGYFVTNAHVVAGADRVTLRGTTGSAKGRVVLFDPDLDIALVRAPDLRVPALVLAPEGPKRGTVGATLGYPNGGAMTILPAAVTAEIRARGRDLYDKAPIIRDVLELLAAIEPGDSGGPLVLANGTVGGVVFAESRTDAAVGYALDPTAVAIAIGPGIGETDAVDTGPCIR